jgi:hypothetical protein
VGTRALTIHVCAPDGPVLISNLEEGENFVLTANIALRHALDVDSLIFAFVDLQIIFLWIQQISNLLIVDLNEGDFDCEFNFLRRCLDLLKDASHHSRNNTFLLLVVNVWSQHGVSLSGTSLSVGKDSPVETLQHTGDDGQHRCVVDVHLSATGVEAVIESVVDWLLLTSSCVDPVNSACCWVFKTYTQ